jgi:hypothetical protein
MAEANEQVQTITIDGVQHELAKFSTEVQRLVQIHQIWEQKVIEAELEYARARAAVRDLNNELLAKLKAELEPAAPEQEVAPAADVAV